MTNRKIMTCACGRQVVVCFLHPKAVLRSVRLCHGCGEPFGTYKQYCERCAKERARVSGCSRVAKYRNGASHVTESCQKPCENPNDSGAKNGITGLCGDCTNLQGNCPPEYDPG